MKSIETFYLIFSLFFRLEAIRNGEATPILDRLVYRKIRALLGGRMRLMLAGGAPLSKEVHEFMRVCIGCPLLQVRDKLHFSKNYVKII